MNSRIDLSSVEIPETIRRVFLESFAARDIAEPLLSFDASVSAATVKTQMKAAEIQIAGIRDAGRVTSYVRRDALENRTCGQSGEAFSPAAVFDADVPLLQALTTLGREPVVFIKVLGEVAGFITRSDLHKAPVRMWLFGIVTMIEMRFSQLIALHCPGDSWMRLISEGRLEKARMLLADRRRRNPEIRLLDCIQLADKGQIVARTEIIRRATIFPSRRQAEDAIKKLERLRNNLAHAQDIASDWDTVTMICDFVHKHFSLRQDIGAPCPGLEP